MLFFFFYFQLAKQDLTLTQLASDLSHQTYSKELFSADVREISNIIQGMLTRLEPSVLDHNIGVWHREQLYKDLLQVRLGIIHSVFCFQHRRPTGRFSAASQQFI